MNIRILLIFFFIVTIEFSFNSASANSNTDISTNSIKTIFPYVILTNYSEDSPFYTGIQTLKNYRDAEIVFFENDILSVLDTLRDLKPNYVTVIISPLDIDEGFAYNLYTLSKQIDMNYDTDFSYGLITGNYPEDVENYIENVILYESGNAEMQKVFKCFWRTGTGAVGGGIGGWGDDLSESLVNSFSYLGLESQRIDTDSTNMQEIIAHLQCSGIIHFLLHGNVTMVEGIYYTSIPDFDSPVMVLNNGCYGGCTSKWYDQCHAPSTGNYEDRARTVDPEHSFALNFLDNGALVYFGHMCMWGNNKWPEILTNALINDQNKRVGDLLIDWYNIPTGPDIYTAEDTIGLCPNDLYGLDKNRFYYSSIILYGDPALRILIETDDIKTDPYCLTPKQFALNQNYPNPFNSSTKIEYSIPIDSQVKFIIYNSAGKIVDILINSRQTAGNYTVNWNAFAMPSGIYFYKISAGSFNEVRKCLLIK